LRETKDTSRKQDSMEERKKLLGSGQTNTDDLNDSPLRKGKVLAKDSTVNIIEPEEKAEPNRDSGSNMTYMGNYHHVHVVRTPSYL